MEYDYLTGELVNKLKLRNDIFDFNLNSEKLISEDYSLRKYKGHKINYNFVFEKEF